MPKLKDKQLLGKQERTISQRDLDVTIPEVDDRTLTLSFSSEEAVGRWYGDEILSHDDGCCSLDLLNSSAPLLFNHDRNDLLGVVEKAWIEDKRGYATVRFGKDERGDWALMQARDKILKNVSVQYEIRNYLEGKDSITIIDWEPFEISLVTIPCDQTVGIGRSLETPEQQSVTIEKRTPVIILEEKKMSEPAGKTHDQILADERSRTKEIDAMCRSHNIDEAKREKMINDGISIDFARGLILEEIGTRGSQLTASGYAPDLSEKEQRSYSMVAAINAATGAGWKKAGLELEISQDIAQRTGKETAGFFMPTNLGKNGWGGKRAPYAVGTGGP
jgi:hypothetical protein